MPNDSPTTLLSSKPSLLSNGVTHEDISEEYATLPDTLAYEDIIGEYDLEWWKHGSDTSSTINVLPVKPETLRDQVTEEDPGADWTLVRSRRQPKTDKDDQRRPSPALKATGSR